MRNLGLKLLALFLAIIIWVGVVGERKSQGNIIITTPIELKNLPDNMELVKISSTMVNVRLSGPLSIIKTLTPLDISLIIDIKKNIPEIDTIKYEKTLNIKLKKQMFKIVKGVKIKDILPPTIQITIEKKMKKTLKVILKGKISPKKGYKITNISINPEIVFIEGPALLLKNRKNIETEDINLKNLEQSIELSVMLKKFDSRIIFLHDIKKVKVKITLKKIQR